MGWFALPLGWGEVPTQFYLPQCRNWWTNIGRQGKIHDDGPVCERVSPNNDMI